MKPKQQGPKQEIPARGPRKEPTRDISMQETQEATTQLGERILGRYGRAPGLIQTDPAGWPAGKSKSGYLPMLSEIRRRFRPVGVSFSQDFPLLSYSPLSAPAGMGLSPPLSPQTSPYRDPAGGPASTNRDLYQTPPSSQGRDSVSPAAGIAAVQTGIEPIKSPARIPLGTTYAAAARDRKAGSLAAYSDLPARTALQPAGPGAPRPGDPGLLSGKQVSPEGEEAPQAKPGRRVSTPKAGSLSPQSDGKVPLQRGVSNPLLSQEAGTRGLPLAPEPSARDSGRLGSTPAPALSGTLISTPAPGRAAPDPAFPLQNQGSLARVAPGSPSWPTGGPLEEPISNKAGGFQRITSTPSSGSLYEQGLQPALVQRESGHSRNGHPDGVPSAARGPGLQRTHVPNVPDIISYAVIDPPRSSMPGSKPGRGVQPALLPIDSSLPLGPFAAMRGEMSGPRGQAVLGEQEQGGPGGGQVRTPDREVATGVSPLTDARPLMGEIPGSTGEMPLVRRVSESPAGRRGQPLAQINARSGNSGKGVPLAAQREEGGTPSSAEEPSGGGTAEAGGRAIDLERLADQVYSIIEDSLTIERESLGI